jgi:3-isopropylmalate/(R)-2-methylmalate dehydratase small subunit
MILEGHAKKFGDNISTDLIAPGRLFHLRNNLPELAKHVLEDAEPNFYEKIQKGDFIVGGRNFGLGSSREHAPAIIKIAGIGAVLAQSVARIFFRNAINVGLPVFECDTSQIEAEDLLRVDVLKGTVENLTKEISLPFHALPHIMVDILNDGGLMPHIQKHGGFNL